MHITILRKITASFVMSFFSSIASLFNIQIMHKNKISTLLVIHAKKTKFNIHASTTRKKKLLLLIYLIFSAVHKD